MNTSLTHTPENPEIVSKGFIGPTGTRSCSPSIEEQSSSRGASNHWRKRSTWSPVRWEILVNLPPQIKSQDILTQSNPSSHSNHIAKYSNASKDDVTKAIDAALAAKPAWETLPFADRAAIFLKAADLIAGKYRFEIMAATVLGQGKNAWQAEIDSAAELCDFLRYGLCY